MADQKGKKVDVSVDKVTIKNLAMGGLLGGGGECFVDVKDGKAIRIRPYKYDWKTDFESLNPWTIERNGEKLSPLAKALPAPFSLAYKKRTFSPNRVKFPMVRVDWDPKGERNTQNRGKSKFRRISWDEALDIITAEITRIHKEYGPLAILAQGDGHGENKTIHTPHGHQARLLDMMGGFTQQVRNPDSWEGWYWGAKHVWGQGFQGMMSPAANLIKDISENSELVLKWGCDEETTPWGFTGQYASRISQFWTRAGIKQVYICPDLNYAAAVHADKWIPVLPNTDAALQLAIIYVWLTEGTWDQEYVKTHAVGMDKVADYVLGKDEDGTPHTPEWASKICGVSEWTIKALAREFAKNDHFDSALLRRVGLPRPVLARARPPGVRAAGHAGPRRPRRASVPDDLLRHAARRGSGQRALLQPRSARASDQALLDHRACLGSAAYTQDPHPGRHHEGPAGIPRQRRPGVPDRGAVHQVHLPHSQGEGRRAHTHDVDRHALPHNLLEPRQLDHRGHEGREHRVRASPASVAGERLPVRRHDPAGQHHP